MRPASAGTAHNYTFKTSYLSLLVNVQDLSLLANVVDRLTTHIKPSHVVLSEGERGLLEAHLHVLCHKLEKHFVTINSSRRQGGTLATGTRQRTKRIFTNRECHLCGTRFTSQWRTGPTGPSSHPSRCATRVALGMRGRSSKSEHDSRSPERLLRSLRWMVSVLSRPHHFLSSEPACTIFSTDRTGPHKITA